MSLRTTPDGVLEGVRIFEFDADSRLVHARRGPPCAHRQRPTGLLDDAQVTHWPTGAARTTPCRCATSAMPHAAAGRARSTPAWWPPPCCRVSTMSTVELWRYSQHLSSQEQAAQPPRDPVLEEGALPAGLPGDGGAGAALRLPAGARRRHQLKVFGGILLGISFVLLNNVAGPPRRAARLDALAGGRGAEHAVPAAVAGRVRVAGALPLRRQDEDRPAAVRPRRARSALGRAVRAGGRSACARRARPARAPGVSRVHGARHPHRGRRNWPRRLHRSTCCRCSWVPAAMCARTCRRCSTSCARAHPAALPSRCTRRSAKRQP